MAFNFIVITLCCIFFLIYSFVLEIKIEKRNKASKRTARTIDTIRQNTNIDIK